MCSNRTSVNVPQKAFVTHVGMQVSVTKARKRISFMTQPNVVMLICSVATKLPSLLDKETPLLVDAR